MKCLSSYLIYFMVILVHDSQLFEHHKPIDKNITEHKNWELIPKVCGISRVRSRIINGKLATLGQFPWLVRLGYSMKSGELEFSCSGSLITSNCVLTAAHCVEEQLEIIRVGENNIGNTTDCDMSICAPPVQDKKPIKFIIHSNYSVITTKNDIALIELDSPVTFNRFVLPVCLPTDTLLVEDFVTEYAIVAGWGFTDSSDPVISNDLLFVDLPIRDKCACEEIYTFRKLDESQLCVGLSNGKDSCNGDSGGPLVKSINLEGSLKYFVLGLVSYGLPHCGEAPSVYTNVRYFMKWILDSLDELQNTYPI